MTESFDVAQSLKDRGFNEGKMMFARAYEQGFDPNRGVAFIRGSRAYIFGEDGGIRRFVRGEQEPYSAKAQKLESGEEVFLDGNYKAQPNYFEWCYPVSYFQS